MQTEPFSVVLHVPDSEDARRDLSRRIAEQYAELVFKRIQALSCPARQKQQLLDAVIETVRAKADRPPPPERAIP